MIEKVGTCLYPYMNIDSVSVQETFSGTIFRERSIHVKEEWDLYLPNDENC